MKPPWFIVPHAPAKNYIHRELIEARIYDTLSVGGGQIAIVGEAGIGYGISTCTYLRAHLTRFLENHNSRCTLQPRRKKNNQRRMCYGFPQAMQETSIEASVK